MDLDDERLWAASVDVLRSNDGGGWTKAAPDLYPHQWSWDSAFIAIGWAHIDPLRAVGELERLFARQWATGKVPKSFSTSASRTAARQRSNRSFASTR